MVKYVWHIFWLAAAEAVTTNLPYRASNLKLFFLLTATLLIEVSLEVNCF
jgi:hypothetical protein